MVFQHRIHPRSAMQGVGLIEVLIAILVLAIGMLGIAALQATTLRNSQGAYERSTASVQMYSIIDSMRSNRQAAIGGDYNMASFVCVASPGGDLAGRDQYVWLQSLKEQLGDLPTTCGRIACDAGGVGDCTISVRWSRERGLGQVRRPGTLQTLTTMTRI